MALQGRRLEAVLNFPGWETRLYLDGEFTEAFAGVMKGFGYTVVHLAPSKPEHPTWHRSSQRMRVMDDLSVDVFMLRDLDSALSPRDALSVWAWMDSGVNFLSLHDHKAHYDVLMAGMWGGRRQAVQELFGNLTMLKLMDDDVAANHAQFKNDQEYLTAEVWPVVKPFTLNFDSKQAACKHDGLLCNPFPMAPLDTPNFVGGIARSKGARDTLVNIRCTSLVSALSGGANIADSSLETQFAAKGLPRLKSSCG